VEDHVFRKWQGPFSGRYDLDIRSFGLLGQSHRRTGVGGLRRSNDPSKRMDRLVSGRFVPAADWTQEEIGKEDVIAFYFTKNCKKRFQYPHYNTSIRKIATVV
jgi:hypothetical protein